MKPFNLEAALAGAPVVNKFGNKVRIVDTNHNTARGQRLVIIVIDKDTGYEYSTCIGMDGKSCSEELFMTTVKREGWLNIYPITLYPDCNSSLHETREKADFYAGPNRIDCIRIEWEETPEALPKQAEKPLPETLKELARLHEIEMQHVLAERDQAILERDWSINMHKEYHSMIKQLADEMGINTGTLITNWNKYLHWLKDNALHQTRLDNKG